MAIAPKTVLVLAHECAPYHRVQSTVGALRPASFARILPTEGWRTIVVCCDVNQRNQLPPHPRASARERITSLTRRILETERAAWENCGSLVIPIPSFTHTDALDRRWSALAARTSAKNANATGGGRFSRITRVLSVAERKLLMLWRLPSGSDYSRAWRLPAYWAAETILEFMPVDVVIAEHTPEAPLFVARDLAQRRALPWIADFRDPILQPFSSPWGRRLYRPVVRRLLASASACVEVTPNWGDLARALWSKPIRVIPNGFEDSEWPVPRPSPDATPGPLRIGFFGNFSRFHQVPLFLDGLARARDLWNRAGNASELPVIFSYAGHSWESVRSLADARQLGEIVAVRSWAPRPEAQALMCKSDVLLIVTYDRETSKDVYFRQGYYPAKVFDYLAARRPIWSVGGDGGALDQLLQTTRAGISLGSVDEIARAIIDAVAERTVGRIPPYHGDPNVVALYSREVAGRKLAQLLDQVRNHAVTNDSDSPN